MDAVLGQGEALDCYNMKLQDAATERAYKENEELQQKIDSVNEITDPIEKADSYKKIFGNCCPDQTEPAT